MVNSLVVYDVGFAAVMQLLTVPGLIFVITYTFFCDEITIKLTNEHVLTKIMLIISP